MTAESMVLAYWGYGTDYNPNDLSQEQQNELRNTALLMHEWENLKMKKVKADAAAYEMVNTSQEWQLDKLKSDYAKLSKHCKDMVADLSAQREQLREKDREIEKLKGEVVGMDGEIKLLRAWLRDAITVQVSDTTESDSSTKAEKQSNENKL